MMVWRQQVTHMVSSRLARLIFGRCDDGARCPPRTRVDSSEGLNPRHDDHCKASSCAMCQPKNFSLDACEVLTRKVQPDSRDDAFRRDIALHLLQSQCVL